MTNKEAIVMLRRMQEPEPYDRVGQLPCMTV